MPKLPKLPKPPEAFSAFLERYPKLGDAWERTTEAGMVGPIPERAQRVVKLAIAIGALREGAVRSGVRKAIAAGVPRAAIDQVVALAAGTLGFPATVAVFTWVREAADGARRVRRR